MGLYWSYWGKAQPKDDAEIIRTHPLAHHSLDVAATGLALFEGDKHLRTRLVEALGMSEDVLRRLLPFLLSLHDLGKFSYLFQGLQPQACPYDSSNLPRLPYKGHPQISLRIWDEWMQEGEGWLASALSINESEDAQLVLSDYYAAVARHHGRPVEAQATDDGLDRRDLAAAEAFIRDVLKLFPLTGLEEHLWPDLAKAQQGTWLLAGFTVLADWIGSNQEWFPYTPADPARGLQGYWQITQARAAEAVKRALVLPLRSAPFRPADILGTYTPTPLQNTAKDAVLAEGPQLFILEDQTGAGKTEAALILARRLMAAGKADGLFFALPTMATANAIWQRLQKLSPGRFFDPVADDLAPILSHSKSRLIRQLVKLGRYGNQDEMTAESGIPAWYAQDRRKSALAPLGVGTIDQVLLAVLPNKYQVLRLLGHARQVLIVDEVHAYDSYMRKLLCKVLEFHAALGGSAILLSATLPKFYKRELLRAYGQKSGDTAISDNYPLLTTKKRDGGETAQTPVASREGFGRCLPVRRLDGFDAAVDYAVSRAARGEAVVWIRNTVEDARLAYEKLREHFSAEHQVRLFHARFALCDRWDIEDDVLKSFGKDSMPEQRQGRLVVATQVVEQSLDLDFDAMITDLAPIDLIIQRAGRLHRHKRHERPAPELAIVSPAPHVDADASWYSEMFNIGQYVYPDHGRLWATAEALFHTFGQLNLPQDARALIEHVYGDDLPDRLPAALVDCHSKAEDNAFSDQTKANFNALNLKKGYVPSGGIWLDDAEVRQSRLGDDHITLRLARWSDGQLFPWAREEGDAALAWSLSEVTIGINNLARLGIEDEKALYAGVVDEASIRVAQRTMPDEGKGAWMLPLHRIENTNLFEYKVQTHRGVVTFTYSKEKGLSVATSRD